MAGDRVVYNLLERAISSDWNDTQAVLSRTFAEFIRRVFQQQLVGLSFGAADPPNFVGGLDVTFAGGSITVSEGVLYQLSTTLPPVPGPLDSPLRVARLGAPVGLTAPAPGVETWYLLEAQSVDVVGSAQVRDIYVPATNTFNPLLVDKRVDRTIQFTLTPGTPPNLPPPTAGRIPIAALRISGAGIVQQNKDLRRLPSDFLNGVLPVASIPQQLVSANSLPDAPSELVDITVQLDAVFGDAYARAQALNLNTATYLEPGLVLAANTWYYLWLGRWQVDYAPSESGPLLSRGVLVLSDNPPSVPLAAFPPPWNAPGSALFQVVGALRRNAANTGWIVSEERDRVARFSTPLQGAGGGSVITLFNDLAPVTAASRSININLHTAGVPQHATRIIMRVQATLTATAANQQNRFEFLRQGDTNTYQEFLTTPYNGGPASIRSVWDISWPIERFGPLLNLQMSQLVGAGTTDSQLQITLLEYSF